MGGSSSCREVSLASAHCTAHCGSGRPKRHQACMYLCAARRTAASAREHTHRRIGTGSRLGSWAHIPGPEIAHWQRTAMLKPKPRHQAHKTLKYVAVLCRLAGGRLWRDVFTPQATFPALSRPPPSRATLLLLHAGTPSLRRAVHTTRARHAERCRARQKRARTGTGLLVSRRVSSVSPPTKGRCGGRRGGARHGVFRSENRTQWHDALGAQASAWNGFSFPSLEVITVGPSEA